jgi:hypothetical protein
VVKYTHRDIFQPTKEINMSAKTFIVNIGLNTADSSNVVAVELARQILNANDFLINKETVLESDSEPTLVAEVSSLNENPLLIVQLFNRVAEDLDQDCIAVYREKTNGGALIGPRAKKWGAFNREYFFLPNGKRLSEAAAA